MTKSKNITAFIPIKTISRRIPGKNFRPFAGHPLFHYIMSAAVQAQCFDDIYVHTDSDEVRQYAAQLGIKDINAPQAMVGDYINGNMLMNYWAEVNKSADVLIQLFATAPLLTPESIKGAVQTLVKKPDYDSVFTATEELGWFWCQDLPVNFRPSILPRSQDSIKVTKETTGLYGMRRAAVETYRQRIGAKPYIYQVDEDEALDIDTEADWMHAEAVAIEKKLNTRVTTAKIKAAQPA